MGHRVGDLVLSNVARLLHTRLRESDFLGRLGGDEFVVLLPRADRAQAEALAAQLLQTIAAAPAMVDGAAIVIAASIGIALIPEHGESVDELLAHADAAMFRAKAEGRNHARVYAPEAT